MLKRFASALAIAVVAWASLPGRSLAQSAQDLGMPKVMIGDQFGFCATQTLQVPIFQTTTITTTTVVTETIFTSTSPPVTTSSTTTTLAALFQTLEVCNPYAGRVAFKICENESPEPQSRVYIGYSCVDGVRGLGNAIAPTSSASSNSSTVFQQLGEVGTRRIDTTTTKTVDTTGIGVANPRASRHAELLGAEYAFLDGNASIGMRLPFFQQNGDGSFNTNDLGDLSVISKLVLFRDDASGSLLSGGLMVTAPTGPAIETIEGNIRSTLLQPYLGYRWQAGNFFLHGFSSVVIPTDDKDVMLALNSVGAGYTFQRSPDSLVTSISPVTELHVTTPLNHTGAAEPIAVPDILSITAGAEFGLGDRGLLVLGLTTPVTGPRTYDLGVTAYLNIRF